MKKTLEIDVVVKTHRIIEIEEIKGTDFVFYTETRNIDNNGEKSIEVVKGVTSVKNIETTTNLNYIKWSVDTPKMTEGRAVVAAIHKNNFDILLQGKKYVSEVIESLNSIYENNDSISDDYMLVLWDVSSHKIADLNYNFIPIPIFLGYIEGSVDNETYDLEKLLEKLKDDENVVNKENLSITDIPYYNAYEGRDKSIEFAYLLPTDIYQNVVCMDSYAARRYILEEIIGADEFRIDKESD